MEHLASPMVPVSWGELIDKITILDIKRSRLSRPEARVNAEKEHALLRMIGETALRREDVASLSTALRRINTVLESELIEEKSYADARSSGRTLPSTLMAAPAR